MHACPLPETLLTCGCMSRYDQITGIGVIDGSFFASNGVIGREHLTYPSRIAQCDRFEIFQPILTLFQALQHVPCSRANFQKLSSLLQTKYVSRMQCRLGVDVANVPKHLQLDQVMPCQYKLKEAVAHLISIKHSSERLLIYRDQGWPAWMLINMPKGAHQF